MAESRLLERLIRYETDSGSTATSHSSHEVQSIVNHLRRLLNTRVGSTLIGDDYGIPDLTNVIGTEYSQTLTELRQAILQAIKKYEPRLENVKISVEIDEDDPLCLKFRTEGYVVGGENLPVIFETVISTDGKINIAD